MRVELSQRRVLGVEARSNCSLTLQVAGEITTALGSSRQAKQDGIERRITTHIRLPE